MSGDPIASDQSRSIKLGAGTSLARDFRQQGTMDFTFREVPHDLWVSEDGDTVTGLLKGEEARRRCKPKRGHKRTLLGPGLYTLCTDCSWITFFDNHLWWAFAEHPIRWLGGDGRERGVRARLPSSPWCKEDSAG